MISQTSSSVEAVICRAEFDFCSVMTITRQVPLADDTSRIAGVPQHFGDRDVVRRERRVGWSQVVDNAHPRWVLARQQRGSIGRTNGCRGIRLGQPDAFPGKPIKVRSFVERIAVTAQFGPSEIIGQHEHNVGATGGSCGRGKHRDADQDEGESDAH